MNEIVLFRQSDLDSLDELQECKKHFRTTFSRTLCLEEVVIGRYSVLPYYTELENDLRLQGSKLINDYSQHRYIANFDYYEDIAHLTFPTWFDTMASVPMSENGPFVVKGRTNSRKQEWGTRMYAKDRADAVKIQCSLLTDSLIGQQGIVFRKYIPLKKLGENGVTGQPFVNEWRAFYYKKVQLALGYYWSIAEEDTQKKAMLDDKAHELLANVSSILADKVNFYCVDIAQKEDGDWIVVEVNDGQMAGLPYNQMAAQLYSKLKMALEVEKGPKKWWVLTKAGCIGASPYNTKEEAEAFIPVALAHPTWNYHKDELSIVESAEKPMCYYDVLLRQGRYNHEAIPLDT